MTQIVGIRDGHRVITTVTGRPGEAVITRRHHPDCQCSKQPSLRASRRRQPTAR